jgi:hypothetical protein
MDEEIEQRQAADQQAEYDEQGPRTAAFWQVAQWD